MRYILAAKRVRCGNRWCVYNTPLRGDTVEVAVTVPDVARFRVESEESELEVLYEDDYIIAVDKVRGRKARRTVVGLVKRVQV